MVNCAHDALYRVMTEAVVNAPSGPNGSVAYTYDAVGNRLARNSALPDIRAATYAYDANDRLSTDQYDANGNTRSTTLRPNTSGAPVGVNDQYDFENRMIGAWPSTLNPSHSTVTPARCPWTRWTGTFP